MYVYSMYSSPTLACGGKWGGGGGGGPKSYDSTETLVLYKTHFTGSGLWPLWSVEVYSTVHCKYFLTRKGLLNLFRNTRKNVECSSCDGVHLKWERSLSTRLFHSTIILMIPISTFLSSHETCVNCCVLLKSLFRYSGANKCTLKYLGKTSLFY